MFGLSQFFSNIQKTFAKEFFVRNAIRDSIKNQTKIELKIEDISINDGVINIKRQSPAILSAIFIKKPKIIQSLIDQGLSVTDIR